MDATLQVKPRSYSQHTYWESGWIILECTLLYPKSLYVYHNDYPLVQVKTRVVTNL